MKETQGVFLTGYVTVKVIGHYPELFFDVCARKGVTVWNIKKTSKTECEGNIRLRDIPLLKSVRRNTVYKVTFVHRKGIPFLSKRFLSHKPLIIGLFLSMFFVLFLSNIVWDVKVKGVHPEIEKRIVDQLNEYGIQPGAMKFKIDPPSQIQQQLLNDIPELLWVGVTEKGTTYHLEGVEKTVVEEEETNGPRNLVAAKDGVIVDMYVSKGRPVVQVNDYVERGDLLVSGALREQQNEEDEDSDEEKKDEQQQVVSAEGEVIAKTWYETEVNIPLKTNYEVLTGENKYKYFLKFASVFIPIWGFTDPDFDQIQTEVNERQFKFLKWDLPISFVEHNVQEKTNLSDERSKEVAVKDGIEQAKTDLQKQLGPDAKISFEKVLHESIDSGKVNLNLYFTVEEDIVKIQPLSQGD
ncbi:sporulation protein YqfD [Aquibacillus sediminis]|uniref:sporulation protein YqfD n=1 Tax=Aquibacillus sediminis TaxID=2574734 RepID=UPI00110944FB|nr:sporulation protein YqfD [Aquibacillus sediminis]